MTFGTPSNNCLSSAYCPPACQFVNIANNNGTANFTAIPGEQVAITTQSPPPDGEVGSYYSAQFDATGCQTPYNWNLSPGSPSLPSGLGLDSNGILSGVPDTPGSNCFSVRVTDSAFHTADQWFSLVINPRPVLDSLAKPSASQFQFRLLSLAGQDYAIQYSTTLTNWTTFLITNAPAPSITVTDFNATNSRRFYRAKVGTN